MTDTMTNCPEIKRGLFSARLLSDGSIELERRGLVGRSKWARQLLWQRSQLEGAMDAAARRRDCDADDYRAVLHWALEQMPRGAQ